MTSGPGTPGASGPPGSMLPRDLDATLVLLRHGESEWITEGRFQGQGDSPLSALGRRQAELAAERLAQPHRPPALPIPSGPPIAIHHSPLMRTTETATRVAAAMAGGSSYGRAPTLVPDAGFLEIGQGEWEGVPGATIAERWGSVLEGWRRDPLTAWAPGGESLPAVDARVRASLRALLANLGAAGEVGVDAAGGTDAAGGAHAAAVAGRRRSHVLGYAEHPTDEPWVVIVGHDGVFKITLLALLDLPLARFWSFPFALAGISVVEVRGGRPRLRLHNAADHLGPLEDEAAIEREDARRRSGAL
ncbi:MAG TPA: histidine phosphatase family protein [Candidatus Limnocylindrales bacterium]|nr:histidine phosphatase family protein [Candidatus Limnocylindrales bacterium]